MYVQCYLLCTDEWYGFVSTGNLFSEELLNAYTAYINQHAQIERLVDCINLGVSFAEHLRC